jgi:hypothetical protein
MAEQRQRQTPPRRESWRLTFHFDGSSVRLRRSERLPMVAPGAVGESPRGGEHGGAWLEVLDAQDRVIFHRLLHDPFALRAEHHSPDGRIEVHFRRPEPTNFEVLVPALPGAESVRLWVTPPSQERVEAPAREQGRFTLTDREDDLGS